MLNMPQRQTLIKQTVDVLREGIATGVWKNFLPGERELCWHLQVSRPTLRAAIEIVEREGLIAVHQGKRSTILKKQRRKLTAATESVALISKSPLHSLSRNRIFLVDYLQRVLQERGLRLEIVSHPGFGTSNPTRALQYLKKKGDFKAFVLTLSSRAVQQWFCDHSLPTLVLGSTFPGLRLPSVDTDYPSIGRHAAGLLLGKEHRRIAWIIPDFNYAGDLETEESFLSTLRQSGHATVQCRIIRHGTSSKELIKKVQAVMSSPQPPTAFFVISAFAATSLVAHLLSRSVRIPEDISVVVRDYDPLLEWLHPSVAHYVFPLRRLASRISRLVVEMADSDPSPLRHIRIMPQFCNAESLGQAPEN